MIMDEVFEIARAFDEREVSYWLFGGNAVELLADADIRDHYDIDLFLARRDAERAIETLASIGFDYHKGSLDRGDIFYRRGDLLVDLVPIDDSTDPPRGTGELSTVEFPAGFLTPVAVETSRGRVVTLRPEMHVLLKTLVRDFYGLTEMREKDLVDLEHLSTLTRDGAGRID